LCPLPPYEVCCWFRRASRLRSRILSSGPGLRYNNSRAGTLPREEFLIAHTFVTRALWWLGVTLAVTACQSPSAPSTNTEAPGDHRPAYRSNETPSATTGNSRAEETAGRRPRRGRPDEEAAAGQFDFYLLNLSWSPEFCATHGSSPECGHGLGFVVHGLWPQYDNGDYPQHCSNAPGPSNPQADTDIIPTVSLVEHEWQTHGTCSGLSADDYFARIHQAYHAVTIPASIGKGSDSDGVPPENLLARFAAANPSYPQGSFALSCGNNRLTAIEICLSKSLSPQACQGVRSCRANIVKVTPP
jgi:ribonuclease T2